MNWDDLRYFLALARVGTLSGAAKQLGVRHTTVSRRVHALEEQAGTRLFDQQPRGYTLTQSGEDVLHIAESVEAQMLELDRSVLGRDSRLSGPLRFTTFDAALESYMDIIAAFARRYPLIELELLVAYELRSLTKREADVALRMTSKPPEHLVGRRVTTWDFAVYASRSLADSAAKRDDLDGYRWVVPARRLGARTTETWIKKNAPNHLGEIIIDDLGAQVAAVRSGMGIASLPRIVGDAEPELVALTDSVPALRADLWLLTHPDLRTTARVRAFTDHLAEALRAAD